MTLKVYRTVSPASVTVASRPAATVGVPAALSRTRDARFWTSTVASSVALGSVPVVASPVAVAVLSTSPLSTSCCVSTYAAGAGQVALAPGASDVAQT